MVLNYVANWWEVAMLTAISINTIINIVVFFRHRFRQRSKD
tara:strand:+ start:605 stop:727 length:123 start_codon:yes stop_codon:yes gene_type:complete